MHLWESASITLAALSPILLAVNPVSAEERDFNVLAVKYFLIDRPTSGDIIKRHPMGAACSIGKVQLSKPPKANFGVERMPLDEPVSDQVYAIRSKFVERSAHFSESSEADLYFYNLFDKRIGYVSYPYPPPRKYIVITIIFSIILIRLTA